MATHGSSVGKVGVLFVQTKTAPPLGADTWIHVQIIRELDRSSFDVHAACVAGSGATSTPTYDALHRIPGMRLLPITLGPELSTQSTTRAKMGALVATLPAIVSFAKLARYVRRHRIAVVQTTDRPRDAFACVLLARLTGTKCIVHAHVSYGEWMSRLLKWSLKQADAVIAVSRFVADSLISNGRDASSTFVVLNAIHPTDWQPGAGRGDGRRELGINETAPVVITVSRLFPGKGPAELIRAVGMVRRHEPDVRLVVVGADMTADGWYTRELSELADEVGLDDHVIFTGRRDDVSRLMASADVFGMASLEEPFGLVYLEAMAMQVPVVAFESGGTPEVVEHARSGLLSPPGDLDALAESLLTLLRDPDLRQRMGEYGRRAVEERFTAARMARDVERVYHHVAGDEMRASGELEGAGDVSSVNK